MKYKHNLIFWPLKIFANSEIIIEYVIYRHVIIETEGYNLVNIRRYNLYNDTLHVIFIHVYKFTSSNNTSEVLQPKSDSAVLF